MKNATLMTALLVLSVVQGSAIAHQTTMTSATHIHASDYLGYYAGVCVALFALVLFLKKRAQRKRWPVAKR